VPNSKQRRKGKIRSRQLSQEPGLSTRAETRIIEMIYAVKLMLQRAIEIQPNLSSLDEDDLFKLAYQVVIGEAPPDDQLETAIAEVEREIAARGNPLPPDISQT
jgi:transcription initiation factor IIF auxiliary subunit